MSQTNLKDATPSNNKYKGRWAVVGGGMLGLTLTHRLAQQGQNVTLLEAAPQLGGLTSVWTLGEAVWDRYYHVTLLSDTYLRDLLTELQLEEEINWIETKTGFYSEGNLISMSNNKEFLTFPVLTLFQRLRLGGTIFLGSRIKNWKRLEKIPVSTWLKRWSGKAVFEKIWLPLLKCKLGTAYTKTSAAFIWASISRMYAARRTGHKVEMFGYVPGGYRRILDKMSETIHRAGGDIRCNAAVQETVRQENGTFLITYTDGTSEEYDRVIYATPSNTIASTCSQLNEDETKRLTEVEYLGIVCASMLVEKPISEYYVTNIIDDWVPLTAVIEMGTIVPPEETAGCSLIYLPKYVMPDDVLIGKTDEEVKELFLTTLEKMYPHFSRTQVKAFRIARTKSVMALPTIGYSENLPPQVTSVEGLYIINSAFITKGNLNVNESIRIAEEAFEKNLLPIINDASLPTLATPPQDAVKTSETPVITVEV